MPFKIPLNYLEYKQNLDSNVHIQVFKATIKANNKMVDKEIANLFNFTLRDNTFNWCNNYMRNNPNYRFAYLEQTLRRCVIEKYKMMNSFIYN